MNLFVYSDDDAVFAVQQPDGSFVCNDDAGTATVDPLVTIKNPAAGAYKVHVGTAKKDQPALGFLAVTQMSLDDAKLAALDLAPMLRRRERPRPQALPQLDPKALLLRRSAIFGSTELQPGFKPVQAFVAGGGDIAAFNVEDKKLTCAGFVSAVPSYSFTWTGKAQGIRLILRCAERQHAGSGDAGSEGAVRHERSRQQPEPGASTSPLRRLETTRSTLPHGAQHRGRRQADHHRRPQGGARRAGAGGPVIGGRR